jgi:hypothetical protein
MLPRDAPKEESVMFAISNLVKSFLFALLLLPAVAVNSTGQQQKALEADVLGSRPQVVRGQTAEIKVYGKKLTLQSAEVNPPGGVKVMGINESTPDPRYAATQDKNVKNWTISLSASPDAQLGERSLVLRSAEGRSKAETIRIVSHTPKISDLKITSTDGKNVEVNFEIAVFDEAGDITAEKIPSYMWLLRCGKHVIIMYGSAKQVIVKDAKNSVAYFTFSQPGTSADGTCICGVHIEDAEGNTSNELDGVVRFLLTK